MNALVIDASGLIYRSFFALPPLTSPQGRPTGALYGFIRSVLKVYEKIHPEFLVSVFDARGNKESRLKLYAEYKATRRPTPPELIEQIEEAKKFCTLWGIPMLALDGVEADDTIASIVQTEVSRVTGVVYICSADKDLAQLVTDRIHMINPAKDDKILDKAGVKEVWGIEPGQMIDYLSLIGDTSDNIPGIEGVGPKTALELLGTWKTLENILDNADAIPGKKGEKIRAGRESALLSKKLIALDSTLPIPTELSFYKKREMDTEKALEFFHEKGFRTLESLVAPQGGAEAPKPCTVTIVEDKKSFDEFLNWLKGVKVVALDCETTDIDEYKADLVGIGIAASFDHVYYISCKDLLFPKDVVAALNTIFQEYKISLLGHNIKYDLHVLSRYGLELPHILFDTLIASWLLNAHEKIHNLDELAKRHFNKNKIPIESLIGKGKTARTMAEVPVKDVATYCAEDVEYTLRLKDLFSEELEKQHLTFLFETVEMPLIPVLWRMESIGVYINKGELAALHKTIGDALHKVEKEIYALAGHEFNINSPKQLSQVLFIELNLPKMRRGLSTSADVLEDLAITFPIAQKILDYRQLEKLRSTYLETLPKQISETSGRVHCRFVQSGTATGRLSCQDPNLQNIPIRSELGKKIRAAFEPQKKGWVYISADYSQVELRILAHLSQDPVLLKAFNEDLDVHAMTAAELFSVPLDKVTEEMRRKAKAVNFGVIYGQQAFGLARELHIPTKEAQLFIDHYFSKYIRVLDTIAAAKDKAHKTGMAETITGRRRLLPDINSSDFFIRSAQERLAVNTPFQGTAADMIKMAMISLDSWLREQKLHTMMILQIHDELLFEAPEEEIPVVIPAVRYAMESVMSLSVPLRVEINIGKNWEEC